MKCSITSQKEGCALIRACTVFINCDLCSLLYSDKISLISANIHIKIVLGIVGNFISGGVGGLFYWFVAYPLDNIKARIQVESAHAKPDSYITVVKSIVKKYGKSINVVNCKK